MGSMFDEDHYIITQLDTNHIFPNPKNASDEGLLAFGGDLNPDRILTAYRNGIFPWYSDGDPILWWSPDPRLLLYPKNFKTSKSFARILKNRTFEVTFDRAFTDVISYCATVPRNKQNGTWLNSNMQKAYIRLHQLGFAHSVEVWQENQLIGGLYGISMGKAFFGESMFSLKSNASKIAFRALSDVLGLRGYDFIDCQMKTDHLIGLGAVTVNRNRYLDELKDTLEKPGKIGSWSHFMWHNNILED